MKKENESTNTKWNLLDCSCGIGTQVFGLMEQFDEYYNIQASDISSDSIQQAKQFLLSKENLLNKTDDIFSVCDMRELVSSDTYRKEEFDICIACDNSFPHMLTDNDAMSCLQSIYDVLKENGLMLLTIRDYDKILREERNMNDMYARQPIRIYEDNNTRRTIFQVWDWLSSNEYTDKLIYRVNHYVIKEHLVQQQQQQDENNSNNTTNITKCYYHGREKR